MANLLVTGNGFDLSFGLPTHYKDFLTILNNINSSDAINFMSIYKNLQNQEAFDSNFEEFKLDSRKISEFHLNCMINPWCKYFYRKNEIDSWIDFEAEIQEVLKEILLSLEGVNESIRISVKDNLSNLNIYKILQNKYYRGWFLIKHFNYNDKKFFILLENVVVGLDIDKIFKNLENLFDQFLNLYKDYLKIFVLPLYDNFKGENTLFSPEILINYHYTFNYTPTFEKIKLKLKKTGTTTNHIHGEIYDKEKIVLGFHQSEKIDRIHFEPFTKPWQKLYNDIDKDLYDLNKDFKFIKNIIIFGHSMNISDSYFVKQIFSILTNNKECKLIILYHNEQSKRDIITNILRIIDRFVVSDLKSKEKVLFIHLNDNLNDYLNKIPNINRLQLNQLIFT